MNISEGADRLVFINEPELDAIAVFRAALSEPTQAQRLHAINLIKHENVAERLRHLSRLTNSVDGHDPSDSEFYELIAMSEPKRHEAVWQLSEIFQRYEAGNERKLNVAEYIGKKVWDTIEAKKFGGLQTKTGILSQVRDEARAGNIRGAQGKDTIREIWNTYRGVVHLGMAIDYCEDNPEEGHNVLHLAERVRRRLSENLPRSTKDLYVDPHTQIFFVYLSSIKGPRFRNRGLPFDVN